MKTSITDSKKVNWLRKGNGHSRYMEIYQKIRELPFGKALIIKFDEPNKNFTTSVYMVFRKDRGKPYHIKIGRLDTTFKNWAIERLKGGD